MKKPLSFILLCLCPLVTFSQVGIGTTTPNSKSILELTSTTKGLLIPRMTGAQRLNLGLAASDAGMMVFQTDVTASAPKGLYAYDGAGWCIPIGNGSTNGQTLRWDGNKWATSGWLFNSGSAMGLGTTSPNTQLQIHANAASTTRIQISNGNNNALAGDGLVVGVASNYSAHLIQQENKPLWFGTNSNERMRIDSVGNVGINTTNPTSKLDVNGTFKLGSSGTELTSIMRQAVNIDIPLIGGSLGEVVDVPFPNAVESATVHISPGANMTDLMIAFARVSAPGNVQIKFVNLSILPCNLDEMMFYITVIQ